MKRLLKQVDLTYRLATPTAVTPTTQAKRWFFEVPATTDTDDGWSELLHRIFYDSNCVLRIREPYDLSWLALEAFSVAAVNVEAALQWDGDTSLESAGERLPWCFRQVVWEPAICYYVNDDGRYDALDLNAYSELLAYRALADGADEATVRAFVGHVFPGPASAKVWQDGALRLGNIACVRLTNGIPTFKEPGSKPWTSRPPDSVPS